MSFPPMDRRQHEVDGDSWPHCMHDPETSNGFWWTKKIKKNKIDVFWKWKEMVELKLKIKEKKELREKLNGNGESRMRWELLKSN